MGAGQLADLLDVRRDRRTGIEVAAADAPALADQGLHRRAVSPGQHDRAPERDGENHHGHEGDEHAQHLQVRQQVAAGHTDGDEQRAVGAERHIQAPAPPLLTAAPEAVRLATVRVVPEVRGGAVTDHRNVDVRGFRENRSTAPLRVEKLLVPRQPNDLPRLGHDECRAVGARAQVGRVVRDVGEQDVEREHDIRAVAGRVERDRGGDAGLACTEEQVGLRPELQVQRIGDAGDATFQGSQVPGPLARIVLDPFSRLDGHGVVVTPLAHVRYQPGLLRIELAADPAVVGLDERVLAARRVGDDVGGDVRVPVQQRGKQLVDTIGVVQVDQAGGLPERSEMQRRDDRLEELVQARPRLVERAADDGGGELAADAAADEHGTHNDGQREHQHHGQDVDQQAAADGDRARHDP